MWLFILYGNGHNETKVSGRHILTLRDNSNETLGDKDLCLVYTTLGTVGCCGPGKCLPNLRELLLALGRLSCRAAHYLPLRALLKNFYIMIC